MISGNHKFRWTTPKQIAVILVAVTCLFVGVESKGAPPRAKSAKSKAKSFSGRKKTSTHYRSSATKPAKRSTHSRRKSTLHFTKGRRWGHPRSSRARLAALHLEPQRVEEIQQALIREGLLQGPATGAWDDATRNAMRSYQENNGFSATGLPDAKSLMQLGLGPHPLPEDVKPAAAAQASVNPASAHSNPN